MKAIIRKDESAVSPVIATILMVAITVVLAAVLYVMVSGLIGGTTTTAKPTVSLTYSRIPQGVDVLVGGISPPAATSNFKVNVENVGTTTFGTAVLMPTTTGGNITVSLGAGNTAFYVVWQNPGGSGQVSQGDHFVLHWTGAGSYTTGTTFSFLLIWASDGATLQTINWQV